MATRPSDRAPTGSGLQQLLGFATIVLSAAAALGIALAVLHARAARGRTPPWSVAALHGLLGLGGLAVLLPALRGPPRGVRMGAEYFGAIAAVLLAAALIAGAGPVVARLRRRPVPVLVLGLHATLAIMGLVMLIAYVSMPP